MKYWWEDKNDPNYNTALADACRYLSKQQIDTSKLEKDLISSYLNQKLIDDIMEDLKFINTMSVLGQPAWVFIGRLYNKLEKYKKEIK